MNEAPNKVDPELIKLYGIIFEKFNHEGDGIWKRFNIMLGINAAMFGGFLYTYNPQNRPIIWREIAIAICIGGLLVSMWSTYVLNRLWQWHQHWKKMLMQIEETFPVRDGWVRANLQHPFLSMYDPGVRKVWYGGYNQIFFFMAFIGWQVLIILLLMGFL